ncbi:MAG: hypothetical protein M1812_007385 [Candelaria pacifica]|nr:MAG: hypothetical protein M1812_007385 [Candelaria pacifica]
MEYFDFDQAEDPRLQDDVYNALVSSDPVANLVALGADDCQLPSHDCSYPHVDTTPEPPEDSTMTEPWGDCLLAGNQVNEVNVWPAKYYKPGTACDYCSARQLECFVFYDQDKTDCTCCMSLFRKCSFSTTHAPDDEHLGCIVDTLHDVPEDVCQERGCFTGIKQMHGFRNPAIADVSTRSAGTPSRKEGIRFSRLAVRVLKTWLAAHHQHPYPTAEEKDELKRQTGLKRSQISNWLANARRRNKVRTEKPVDCAVRPESFAGALDMASIPVDIEQAVNMQNMNPLDRWKNSPPEHEAASVSAIANAVATSTYTPENYTSSHSSSWVGPNSSDASSWSVCRVPSMSSLESGRSSGSDMSFGSLFSHASRNSLGSRRRRRRPTLPEKDLSTQMLKSSAQKDELRANRMFQCTFCTDTFKTKHDWQRHEKSIHLSLEKWTCAPLGGLISMPAGKVCVYCSAVNPDADHLETHNFQACQEKPATERTFYRKDHLRQHLRLVHDCKFLVPMESWKSARLEVKSRCGFCPKVLMTWQCRVDHLAAHFKTGAKMADWKGDWGFEPHVQALIENAFTLPLIAIGQTTEAKTQTKRATPHRWHRTATALSTPSDGEGRMMEQGGCLQRLNNGLSAYVREQLQQGAVPTDTELQAEGRLIIFYNDDMWNQTAADNPDWLDWFKKANGITKGSVNPDTIGNCNGFQCTTGGCSGFMSTGEAVVPFQFGGEGKVGLRRLNDGLLAYAREQLENGKVPTDAELQRQGRLIIYSNDDMWNQTAADNPDWLSWFKRTNNFVNGGILVGADGQGTGDFSGLAGLNAPAATRIPWVKDPSPGFNPQQQFDFTSSEFEHPRRKPKDDEARTRSLISHMNLK